MPKCDECGREFTTESGLAQHQKDKHGARSPKTDLRGDGQGGGRVKKRSLRRRNRHTRLYAILAVAVAAGVGVYFAVSPAFAGPPFPCISEGGYIHVHPYLEIWVDGKNVTIPADVGLTQGGACTEPIHTHDSSGVLHLELSQSDLGHNWTLADFFSIWKYTCSVQASNCPVVNGTTRPVVFNQTDILGYRADDTHKVELLINGTASSSWGNLPLLHYAYCTSTRSNVPPCGGPSGTAAGDPAWDCVGPGQCGTYPYKTGNIIVIEYAAA